MQSTGFVEHQGAADSDPPMPMRCQ
jgi:hypothetical protein